MLDIRQIRQNPSEIEELLSRKGYEVSFADFLNKDKLRRDLITEVEGLKSRRNKVSQEIPKLKKEGQDVSSLIFDMKELGQRVAEIDAQLAKLTREQDVFLSSLPNLPAADVRAGGKENNEIVKVYGTKPSFDFKMKNHVELAESLGLIDYVRGAKLAGSGFWVYTNLGARLEWALLNFFMQEHLNDGYEMCLVPHILNYASGYTAGQFPKFEEDVFWLKNDEADSKKGEIENLSQDASKTSSREKSKFILPTAETALVNLYRDEILDENILPRKLFAYTPCYRKEAGSYRAEERGMIRGHQFNKIEMFQYTTETQSETMFEELTKKATSLVEKLGLHFQLSKLAAGDCSSAMAKTYDIEIWLPSMGIYKEVSSVSTARDYQARRGNIKYRKSDGSLHFVHTLNASGLATSRVFPAILEQMQQADGSVLIPEVLQAYMGGIKKLEVK